MSHKIQTLTVSILVAVLLISSWMLFTENYRSTDRLPALTVLSDYENQEADRILRGYRTEQLMERWGAPAILEGQDLVWRVNRDAVVTVFCDEQGKVSSCEIKKASELPKLREFRSFSQEELTGWLLGRYVIQVEKVWGMPSEEEGGSLTWQIPNGGHRAGIRVQASDTGKILQAEFIDADAVSGKG